MIVSSVQDSGKSIDLGRHSLGGMSLIDSMVPNIKRELDSAGYSVIRGGALTLEQFQYIGRSLGQIHEEEQVKIKANEEVLIYRHEAIPLHNDGSEGRYLGLYCIEPGVNPVGTWLVDVSDLLEKLEPATVASLCETTFKRGWGAHEKWFNVLTLTDDSFILYYAPWKLDQPRTVEELHLRFLSAIVHGLAGSPACDLFWGNTEAHIMVIEADGSYELVDNLKAIGNGLTKTGLGVHANSINDFVLHKNNWYDESKLNTVSDKCRGCKILHACRGSYYISRHSASAGFDRESVFCHDMQYLIPKMHATLSRGI
jgi:radical SAM protein with 4Fe4S-binding SPASM domain